MIFEIHTPAQPLRRYIERFVYYEGYMPEHSVDRLLPDGNTEIIIDLTDRPKYIYDNKTLKEIQACRNMWVSGVRTEAISIPSGRDSRMLIVSFRKGMAYHFYPVPMNELTDSVIDADLLFGSQAGELREKLLAERSITGMFAQLEAFLLRCGRDRFDTGIGARCIESAVQLISTNPDTVRMQILSQRIGYSQKHFIAMFKARVGVSPKAYLRILRFQKAVNLFDSPDNLNLHAVAHDCGYYDQAHFNHDFKIYSGFTPGEYLEKTGPFLNYIPVA